MKGSKLLQWVAVMLAIAPAGAIPSAVGEDAVTDWNAIMQATVATPPTNPNFQARWGAIVQLAVFEAVNAITGDYKPYLGTIAAPHWASQEAAAIAAAHRTLVTLRPGSAAVLDALRDASLADAVDLYHPGVIHDEMHFGQRELEAGIRVLKFRIIGKNPASANYRSALDWIRVTPRSEEPPGR